MSIASEITKLVDNLESSYTYCRQKDATMPTDENFDNLPDTIYSIPHDFYATVYVYSENGATVTYNNQSQEITYEGGYATFYVYRTGNAYFTATLDGHSRTNSTYIYDATSSYTLSIPLKSYITVTAPVDTVVTIGSESQTVTETSVTFTVWSTGTYTVTAVYNGATKTNTVTVSALGQTYTTRFAFGQDIVVYGNIGMDVIIQDGRRQTIGNDGYVTFSTDNTGTYKFLCIYNGKAKEFSATVSTAGNNVQLEAYILPDEYQQVQYLQFTQNSGILTDIYPNNNTTLDITFSTLSMSQTSGTYFGLTRWSGSPTYDTFGAYIRPTTPTPNIAFYYGRYSDTKYSYVFININSYDKLNGKLGISSVIVTNYTQGETATETFTRDTFTSTQKMILGGFNNNGSYTIDSSINRIYNAVTKENGTVTGIFVPCYRISDSVKGFYDLISGNFYYQNVSTGTISKGSDVSGTTYSLPSDYTLCNYISSSSAKTQYLNLGTTASYTTGMIIKVWDNSTSSMEDDVFIGARATSNGRWLIGGAYYMGGTPYGAYIYYGYNTLNRLAPFASQWSEYVNARGQVRTVALNLYNSRQENFDNTSAFTIDQTLVQTTPNIYVFGENRIGTFYGANIRLYYIALTSSTSVSKILIPCYRNSDTVVGMYDIVNGSFFTNQGSGSFTYETA